MYVVQAHQNGRKTMYNLPTYIYRASHLGREVTGREGIKDRNLGQQVGRKGADSVRQSSQGGAIKRRNTGKLRR